ncbi:MAG: hypothetical protein A3B78_01510 [Omnitrophica WOR_2 bacterium RIFCSPHIGHO2_02_FULL_67_20]|nr:MAG: hypothetical protein A3B78_01510 [Omnitrophica WOR_2 bacterium RIFCSPHIGHO2_02_FULL_67_20]
MVPQDGGYRLDFNLERLRIDAKGEMRRGPGQEQCFRITLTSWRDVTAHELIDEIPNWHEFGVQSEIGLLITPHQFFRGQALARAGDAEEGLELLPFLNTLGEHVNRLRLIAFGCQICHELESIHSQD